MKLPPELSISKLMRVLKEKQP
ncbi:hypothetical protein [Vibrio parahaemolyticus]